MFACARCPAAAGGENFGVKPSRRSPSHSRATLALISFAAVVVSARAQTAPAATSAAPDQGPLVLEAFSVTGSNIKRTDNETVQPVIRLATGIEKGETGTPLELMERVPVLGSLSVYENQDGGRVRGSASSIDLRGLGGQHTLMLLNGRRLPAYGLAFGGLTFSNINNLPLAAVDRVEVLADGASATYGADATAGVVNFITKRNADEHRLGFRYGNTTDGAAAEYRATFTYGQRFKGAPGGFLFVADAFNRATLMAVKRDFAVLGDLSPRVPAPFNTAAIWNTQSNLGPYASFTVVTQTGMPNTLPGFTGNAAYVDFTGKIQPGTRSPVSYYNDSRDFSLVPGRNSRDVFLSADSQLTPGLQFFTELSYNDLVSRVQQSPMTLASTSNVDAAGNVLVLPATNYYNPFGTRFYGPGTANPTIAARAVQFTGMEPATGPRTARITSSQDRVVGGLRGKLASRWTWESALTYSSNKARDLTNNLLKLSAFTAALNRSTPDALNLFAGPGANPESVLAPLRTDSYTGGASKLKTWDAKATGEVWRLPAGALQIALGVEYRGEGLRSDYAPIYQAGDLVGTAISTGFDAYRTTRATFAELSVPLLHDESRTLFKKAELQLADRFENFTSFGSTTKPRAGLSAMVLPGMFVRASYGEGFRAPSLTQLYGGVSSTTSNRADVFRPQEGTIRRFIFQPPNPALKPEQTKSSTVGVVWEMPFVRGLSLEVNFWRYDLKDQINLISRVTELALEAAGGAYSNPYIVRVAPTAAVPIGPILQIIEPLANYQFAKTSGTDFNVTYKRGHKESGVLTLGADATYVAEYQVKLDPTQPYVSFPPDLGRPRFRATGRVEFSRRDWSAQTSYQYTAHYDPPDRVTVAGQDYWMPSYGLWNFSTSYAFGKVGPLRGVTASVGLNNVFNKFPPLYPTRQGYDARLFSPQGRFAFVNVGIEY